MRGIKNEMTKEKVCPGIDDIQMESIWKTSFPYTGNCESCSSQSGQQ